MIIEHIISNRVQCNNCKDIIQSEWGHHFLTCKCGDVSVDGGRNYLRRVFKEKGCYTDMSETYLENTETGKNVCPYCRSDIENDETYLDDHEECFPC